MGILSAIIHRGVTTEVLELLESQHKEVDELFAKLESGTGKRSALVHELANKLAAHATVEEKVFYPAVMAKATKDMLFESVEEHLAIKRVLADLTQMNLDDDSFRAKISVLKEQVTHHAHREEEKKLFPLVKTLLSFEARVALGNEVLVMFEELMAKDPSRNLPSETAKAASLPSAS
ncbi:hemerythrin domain-containing protein [soil metagenome]